MATAPSTRSERLDLDFSMLVECPICCDLFQEVIESPCCHGLFCRSCLTHWSRSNTTCPGCRAKLLIEQCRPNIPIQRFVESIPMECPFKLTGCGATPPRSELERHKELCPFRPELIEAAKSKRAAEFEQKKAEVERQESELRSRTLVDNAAKALVAESMLTLVQSLAEVGDFTSALNYAERALQLYTQAEQHDTSKAFECVTLLGKIFKSTSQFQRAIEHYKSAFDAANRLALPKEQIVDCLLNLGDIYSKLAKFDEARTHYQQALDTARTHLPPNSSKIAEIFCALGVVAKKCSEYDNEITSYTDALKILPEDGGNAASWAELACNLADVHRKKGNYAEARELYRRSLARLEGAFGQNHPQVAEVCNALGMLAKKEGQYMEALEYYKTALRIGKHFFGESHPSIGVYLTNLGDIYRKQGDFGKAEGIYSRAIELLEGAFGPNHVEVAEVLNSQGLVLKKRAQYDRAEQLYRRAVDIVIKTFGEKHYKVGIYLNNLGDIERKRGRYKEALQTYARARNVLEQTLGHMHSEVAEVLHNMGQVHHQLGEFREALSLYNAALQIVRREFGESHYKVGMFLNSRGLSLAMLNDFTNAYEDLKAALKVLITALGDEHVEVADVLANLGDVCMKLHVEDRKQGNKLEEAKKYYTRANAIVQKALGPTHTKCQQFASLLYICENYASLV